MAQQSIRHVAADIRILIGAARGKRYGPITMCIGGGQGIAIAVENGSAR
jgi:acetyl-CoA acetyltransferase